jgi:hypothetical protein
VTERNCVADPSRTAPVTLPEGFPDDLPPTSVCPMVRVQAPAVQAGLTLWARWRRYGVLPVAGGLEDQRPEDLDALDLIEATVADSAEWAAARAAQAEAAAATRAAAHAAGEAAAARQARGRG